MVQDPTGPGERDESVLLDIDPDLTIFALANGTDLRRNTGAGPDRVLEWYRDGVERRIVIEPSRGTVHGALDVKVGIWGKRDGQAVENVVGFREGMAPGELRAALPQAIDAANALDRESLG